MKTALYRVILIPILCSFAFADAKAQWFQQNSGVTDFLYKVDFPTEDIGYISMATNQLLKTIDGGNNWDTITISPDPWTLQFNYANFPTVDTGYAVAAPVFPFRILVLKTTNGGASWDTILYAFGNPYGVAIVNTKTAYFLTQQLGQKDTLFKTSDGGNTFDTLSIGFPSNHPFLDYITWNSIYFLNKDTGFAMANYNDKGKIARTYDGGASWDTLITDTALTLKEMFFPTAGIGYLTTSNWIIKTTDGGDSWFQLPIVLSGSFPMFFVNADTGYVLLGNEIRKTTDGGFTWDIQESGTMVNLNDIYFVNDTVGYIVGDSGTILKTTNGGEPVGIENITAQNIGLSVFPNPNTGLFTVEMSVQQKDTISVALYQIDGQQVFAEEVGNTISTSTLQINLSKYSKGMYFLKIVTDTGAFTKKVIYH